MRPGDAATWARVDRPHVVVASLAVVAAFAPSLTDDGISYTTVTYSARRAPLLPLSRGHQDGYAALSHVWDTHEQSFQDVRKIQKRCERNGTNPRVLMRTKIKMCCVLAESHGYKWVWIDTRCIDKTSSAEFSEAINAIGMFRYYAVARVCYG